MNLVGEKGILYRKLVGCTKIQVFGVDFSVDFITVVIVKGKNVNDVRR